MNDQSFNEMYKAILQSIASAGGMPLRFLGLEDPPPLHCYDNGYITIVAASLEEAHNNFDEWTQTSRDHFFPEEEEEWEEFHELYQIADDRILNIIIEDELKNQPAGVKIDGTRWTATAGAWAQSQGKGFLCSVEY